ncbi:PREDICTED: uncharacterized protein LOC105368550 isoform X2 [Ceratosolen solmsi marchali]|uniref:Uncharacterized protein LOC105368550 isoform X2 n=1 Tax=Ceratosolen solmsi marchali TaxID=326594 RepID=A0AAJ6YX07_9HYME|nr:PREDICTED: uncharacterized protein LOC105368550 isoform X2 [Ceratosolen solmsi marchali]
MNYGEMGSGNGNTAENNRCSLRRIARHEESEFSNASILNSMEKFVRTVNEMEETILVPSRLLDLAVGDDTDTISEKADKHGCNSIKDSLCNTDLYRLYNIVNQMKVELLWSQENPTEFLADELQEPQRAKVQVAAMEHARLGHARCPSTTSMQSLQSASSLVLSSSASDSDSDTGIENDSGLESEEPSDRLANLAAENFRRHLRGLHRSISHMTEAAEYLTLRYQADVGGQV